MAVTITSSNLIAPLTWRIVAASDLATPVFYLYRDGVLTNPGGSPIGEFIVTVEAGETPLIEIVDALLSGNDAQKRFPGRILLAWYAPASDVDYYRVDELVSAAWVQRARILDPRQDATGYFTWQSRWLEDDTTHQFRVVAVGVNGNESTADSFSVLMVRHPDPPAVSLAWDGGTQKFTVEAA